MSGGYVGRQLHLEVSGADHRMDSMTTKRRRIKAAETRAITGGELKVSLR